MGLKMNIKNLTILISLSVLYGSVILGSGAYDHGTATGKGKLELDFTWNPFGIYRDGQTYIVLGYGLTNRLDVHGYYSHHEASGLDNYYYGLFYQFLRTKSLDLATAIGIRQYPKREAMHAFFPQLLYSIKISSGFSIGGSIVDIRTIKKDTPGRRGTALDVALFVSITKYIPVPDFVKEIKVGVGAFKPGTYTPIARKFLPTYSIDVKLNWKKNDNTQKE